jgi:hypothetical protein
MILRSSPEVETPLESRLQEGVKMNKKKPEDI